MISEQLLRARWQATSSATPELSFDLDQRARRYRAFVIVVAVPSQQRGDYLLPLLLLSAVYRSPHRFRGCSAIPMIPVCAAEYVPCYAFLFPLLRLRLWKEILCSS